MTRMTVSLCLLGMFLLQGGCQLVSAVLYKITPPTVDAVHIPPKTLMLVLVEHRPDPAKFIAEADEVASYISDDLTAYRVAPVVDQKSLQSLRDLNPNMDKMTITQIGKLLGAKQVLYVDLQLVDIQGGISGVAGHGRVSAAVKLVDVDSGKTMFPAIGEGYPVTFETKLEQDINHFDVNVVHTTLIRTLGTSIAQLFHDYVPR